MQENKNYILVVMALCFIWIFIGLWNVYIHNTKEYIVDFVVNLLGITIILLFLKFKKSEKIKLLLACYFFIYGLFFLIYKVFLIHNANSIDIDTFCFLSDMSMIILPIKLYKISINDIIKRLK